MAFELVPSDDDSDELDPVCRRLTAPEYSSYAIREGLERIALATLGPEAMIGMCECDECKEKREKAEKAAEQHNDSKMFG